MKQRIPTWMNLIFLFVGLASVTALGVLLAVLLEGSNPQLPEQVLGPVLCTAETRLDITYSRSLGGGVQQTILSCINTDGQIVTSPPAAAELLWYGLFVLPLVPLTYPIVAQLRRYNLSLQARTEQTLVFSQGQVYTNVADLPPAAQDALKRLDSVFADLNNDGRPDIFEKVTFRSSISKAAAPIPFRNSSN